MKTAKEFVDAINEAKVCSHHYIEDEIDMEGVKEVDTLDHDEHRWYVMGTVVYQVGEEYFGVRGPISLKSEDMCFDDIGGSCVAFEMEAAPSVTYKCKK